MKWYNFYIEFKCWQHLTLYARPLALFPLFFAFNLFLVVVSIVFLVIFTLSLVFVLVIFFFITFSFALITLGLTFVSLLILILILFIFALVFPFVSFFQNLKLTFRLRKYKPWKGRDTHDRITIMINMLQNVLIKNRSFLACRKVSKIDRKDPNKVFNRSLPAPSYLCDLTLEYNLIRIEISINWSRS